MLQGLKPLRLALIAVAGALILETIVTFATGFRQAFTFREVPTHLAAILVGALGGWLFELFRELTVATSEAIKDVSSLTSSVTALTAKITYQDQALSMLTRCPRHNVALTALIRASMSDNFRNIPLVGEPTYLNFLERAIEHSDGYEGIQRRPLRWYKDTDAGPYLVDLKRRNMDYKRRLFIVDDDEFEDMQADLANPEIVEYYWQHTGKVDSYWMTATEFRSTFPGMQIPRDLALYDRQVGNDPDSSPALLICYDEDNSLLTFDVVGDESDVTRLFGELEDMAKRALPVLKEIELASQ